MKVKREKQEKGSRERPRDGYSWEDGEIQGRSIDPGGSVFRSVGGSIGKGTRREGAGAESEVSRMRARGGLGGEGEDESGTIECGESLGV